MVADEEGLKIGDLLASSSVVPPKKEAAKEKGNNVIFFSMHVHILMVAPVFVSIL